jgi:hypothetical protein
MCDSIGRKLAGPEFNPQYCKKKQKTKKKPTKQTKHRCKKCTNATIVFLFLSVQQLISYMRVSHGSVFL